MKIGKVATLISSFSQTPAAPPVEELDVQATGIDGSAAQAVQSDEAAKIASNFGVSDSDSAQQREKVQKLKEQVNSGNYNPDSTEVAKAFIKELGAA